MREQHGQSHPLRCLLLCRGRPLPPGLVQRSCVLRLHLLPLPLRLLQLPLRNLGRRALAPGLASRLVERSARLGQLGVACPQLLDARLPRWRDETCPVSTGGGTRRVQLVREGGGGRPDSRNGHNRHRCDASATTGARASDLQLLLPVQPRALRLRLDDLLVGLTRERCVQWCVR